MSDESKMTYLPSEIPDLLLSVLNGGGNGSSGTTGWNGTNTYSASDEGKVVSNGALVAQGSSFYSVNGIYDTTLIENITVSIPNTFSATDEGKVVSNGALVAQGSSIFTANIVYDTTLINSVTVSVANTFGVSDNSKVVSNGALVAQGSSFYSVNGNYDTTFISNISISIPEPVYSNLDLVSFGNMTSLELSSAMTNPGLTDPRWYEEIAEAINAQPVLQNKTVNANGVIVADSGYDALGTVTVEVPIINVYSASDEGKVVSNGELIEQESSFYSVNGSYDTTLISQITVSVSGYGVEEDTRLAQILEDNFDGLLYDPHVTYVASWMFYSCSTLTSVSFPECEGIGGFAFTNCYLLSSIYFPACKSIDIHAFSNCSSLTEINLPACETIGSSAFMYCRNLSKVYLPACRWIDSDAFDVRTSLPLNIFLLGSYRAGCASFITYRTTNMPRYVYVPSSLYSRYGTMFGGAEVRKYEAWSSYFTV